MDADKQRAKGQQAESSTVLYRGIQLEGNLATSIRHMDSVEEIREGLQMIQAAWDNLALLGQLSGTRIELDDVRSAFSLLTARMLSNLAGERFRKATLELKSKAQVAIDVLVRNLFERTADVGFLATDSELQNFAAAGPELREQQLPALRERFREYQRKYSVYSDVVLLSPAGNVLAQLAEGASDLDAHDPFLLACLDGAAPYVERYGPTPLQRDGHAALHYGCRVLSADGRRTLGVLSLFFRLEDEAQRIFAGLTDPTDWTVLSLVDEAGRVLISSDPQQLASGAQIVRARGNDSDEITRHAGRRFLAAACASGGYQGYPGPGWRGQAMVPLELAFGSGEPQAVATQLSAQELSLLMASELLLSESLRAIPRSASQIQAELHRAVWNGNVALARAAHANDAFSKTLLASIGEAGIRTRDTFSRAISDLVETVVSSTLRDCAGKAALSIDIMDRNLYERANDCRWWALNGVLREALAAPHDPALRARAGQTLSNINGLYTVYTNLILFDTRGEISAMSNPTYGDRIGQLLTQAWILETLALPDSEGYCVSAFEPFALYEDRPTYVYCAAIRAAGAPRRPLGGIAIVFDSEPQLRAMLLESLPHDELGAPRAGAFGVYVDGEHRVIASTRSELAPGSKLPLELPTGRERYHELRIFEGDLYAVGACRSSGYREYKSKSDRYRSEVTALVFVPLARGTPTGPRESSRAPQRRATERSPQQETIDLASFAVAGKWLAVPAADVVEAVTLSHITWTPGAPPYVRGYVTFRGVAVAVLDLARLLDHDAGLPAAETQHLVIIQAGPQRAGFALLVEQLGDTPELPLSRLAPTPDAVQAHSSLFERVVTPESGAPEQPMLLLLSVERLAALAPAGQTTQVALPA